LSTVQYFLKQNVLETGSVSVFRCRAGGIYSVGSIGPVIEASSF